MQLASQLPGSGVIVNQSKQQMPLHVACSHGMMHLTRHLLNQPGAFLDMLDGGGNTLLHCAASCTQPAGLELVKMLINEMGANVCTKNYQGQTPYDMASLNNIRQFLLPIQLQQETKEALANGGTGLPPGVDMGGLKIQNAPPPPISGAGAVGGPPPPQVGPPPTQVGPPPQGMSGPSSAQGIPTSPYPQPPNPFGQSISSSPSGQTSSPYPQPPYPGSAPNAQLATPQSATTAPVPPAPMSMPSNQPAPPPPPPSPYAQPPYPGSAPNTQSATPQSAPMPPAPMSMPSKQPAPPPPAQQQQQPRESTLKSTPTPAPASEGGRHAYALTGYSSAAIYKAAPGSGGIRPDGFHSSSSDKRLQQKYGHDQNSKYAHVPPPPSSGNSFGARSGASAGGSGSAPPSGGPNPYAGGLAHRQRPNRYVNYDPATGNAPPPAVARPYSSYGAPAMGAAPTPTQYNVFQPGSATAQATPAPASASMAAPAPMPPPPFFQRPAAAAAPSTVYASPPPQTTAPPQASPQQQPPQQQAPTGQVSPFAQAPAAVTAPSATAMFASPAAAAKTSDVSAPAVFSSPPSGGVAPGALSGAAPSPTKPGTNSAVNQAAPRSPPPAAAAAEKSHPAATPFASNAPKPANAAAMFSSPPNMGGGAVGAPDAFAAPPPTPPVASVPDQVAFSNRETSGVSVMSSASDVYNKHPGGESSASAAFASPPPPAVTPSGPASFDKPAIPAAATAQRTPSSQEDLVEIIEEEDFDKMDDVPLSPHPIQSADGQPAPPAGMPPPPFSST